MGSDVPGALDLGELVMAADLLAQNGWLEEAAEAACDRIPASVSHAPQDLFFTPRGQQAYREEPGRFTRERLDALARTWRQRVEGTDEEASEADARGSAYQSIAIIRAQVEPILEALATDHTGEVACLLRPQPQDYALVFQDEAVEAAREAYGGTRGSNGACRQAAFRPSKQSLSPEREDETGTYVRYRPHPSVTETWPEHPAEIVESGPMSAVHPPAVRYRSSLPDFIRSNGFLSDLQAESVCLTGQRHQTRLPNGSIGGFFIGDGTGVGKGRQVAAIVLDNRAQGRKKALWVSGEQGSAGGRQARPRGPLCA